MARVIESATQEVLSTLFLVWVYLGEPGFNPAMWHWRAWAALSLVVTLFALLTRKPPARGTKPVASAHTRPRLIISKGAVEQMENSSLQKLSFTVSNLGDGPVQLLELALQTNLSAPLLVEAVELILPYEAVELEAQLFEELVGDAGKLHAFAASAEPKSRIYNLSAKLAWEPWNRRFKILASGQRLRPARKLTSVRLDRVRKQAWARQNPHLVKATPPPPAEAEAGANLKKTATTRRRTLELDFPTKF